MIIYATGLGAVTTSVPSGTGATGADPVEGCNQVSTNARTVLYAGLTPGFPGLYQVDVRLSPYLAPGIDYIYLQATRCWFNGNPPFLQDQGVALYVAP